MENYIFNVDERFKNLILKCLYDLQALGVPVSKSVAFGFNGGFSYFGRTYYGAKVKNKYGREFYITVNKFLLDDNDIKNVIVHELLHTVKGGMNHCSGWRKYADLLNGTGVYNITVLGKHKLNKGAYKHKKAFGVEEFEPETMDIVECPKCKKRLCLRKGLKRTPSGESVYLCAKCRKHFRYI